MSKFISSLRGKFGRVALALGTVCGVCSAHAAEGDFDTTLATQFLTKAETAITGFWTTNQTAILAILGIIVGLSVLWMIVSIVRKATGKAGR